MLNRYIQQYEREKNLKNHLVSAIGALAEWYSGQQKEEKAPSKAGANQGVGLFSNSKAIAKNAAAKNAAVVGIILEQLRSIEKQMQDGSLQEEDFEKIKVTLQLGLRGLSGGDQAQKLVEHILGDISKILYSNRPSSLIVPSAEDVIFEEKSYSADQEWKASLSKMLSKKGLAKDLFKKSSIAFEDDISKHVEWAFDNIYKIPYPAPSRNAASAQDDHGKIARYHHGIQHVTRAATYIPVLANLYRRDDEEAKQLNDDDIKLLQLAALFHDSAREDENVDRWDHESAIFLYMYLTRVLHVEEKKAKLLAEATANKDPNAEGYFVINEKSRDVVSWQWEPQRSEKNIYQKIMHDADCLDIIRARDSFEAEHLDFYKQYSKNPQAIEEMAHLICEVRSLIDIQGDSRNLTKTEVKEKYEHSGAYQACINDIDKNEHRIIATLGGQLLQPSLLQKTELIDATAYDPKLGWTDQNVRAAMREGRVFARGIATPSASIEKPLKNGKFESFAGKEIRKGLRRPNVPTNSGALGKEGNPFRSVSMIGYGSGVFTDAGFLKLDPKIDDISAISSIDFGTGRGKKSHLRGGEQKTTQQEKEKQLVELHNKLKMGGSTVKFGGSNHVANHVEILYHIKEGFSAIFFSNDPKLYNSSAYGSPWATHPYSPVLQAIYLRNEYQRLSPSNSVLPIIEYSGVHNSIRIIPPEKLTDKDIKNMWIAMCSSYIKKCLDLNKYEIFQMTPEEIKTLSMYENRKDQFGGKGNAPADANYPPDFQKELSVAILEERDRLIKERRELIVKSIQEEKASVLSDKVCFDLMGDKSLANSVEKEIKSEIEFLIKKEDLDVKSVDGFVCKISIHLAVLAQLVADKNTTRAENDRLREVTCKSKTMRMYNLANQVGLTDYANYIKNKMAEIVLAKIAVCEKKLNEAKLSDPATYLWVFEARGALEELTVFASLFDLYPGDKKITDKVHDVIEDSFKVFVNYVEKMSLSQKVGDFLESLRHICLFMGRVEWLPANARQTVEKMLSNTRGAIVQADFSVSDLVGYLYVAGQVNLPLRAKKEAILDWMDHHDLELGAFFAANYLPRLFKVIPPDELDFFKRITKCINPYDYKDAIDLGCWIEVVKAIEQQFPSGQKFDKEQIKILQEQLDDVFQKIISQLSQNSDEACKKLAKEIDKILEADMNFKIPDFVIDEFNKRVDSVSLKSMEPWAASALKRVHAKLPLKDKRGRLDAQLVESEEKKSMPEGGQRVAPGG